VPHGLDSPGWFFAVSTTTIVPYPLGIQTFFMQCFSLTGQQ